MDESPVSEDDATISAFQPRRLSLRNKTCSKSPSGVTTEPSENDTVTHEKSESEIIEEVMKPLTDDERKAWKGWCELESDPALFNFILREYGVKDVKIQEVLGLEDEMLQYLPTPVYGLVFLFKYIDNDSEDEEEHPRCPNHVWFANQTTHNACATIALLNIVMNVPDLDLGENISSFKEVTQLLKPAYRGQKLSENEYIRNLHNSFARRMDILNADLALSNEVSAWKKRRKIKKKPGRNKAKSDEEPGFHFIAFVPIEGVVWRLDGLQRQPENLAMTGSPLLVPTFISILASTVTNIHAINFVEVMLSQQTPDWNKFSQADVSEPIRGPSEALGVTDKLLHETVLPESTGKILEQASTDASILLLLRQQWVAEQRELRIIYMDELSSINEENEQAARRKKDHTPLVYRTLRSLADKGLLKRIMEEVQAI
ncbi:hypothetical protein DID88_002413 [Monilinia fructigena]|uniref:Ubiquitin carboxyl-terminal hydrolase n=1 Tax=Monilinia fructigena TaxID=38457 RepID=A0A395IPV5_9HELO|nr:hypothetical protein DID88_002413 [Monilinia fructigena]